ncbi:MAG: hypothetical protein KME60_18035 [Cyanomargarita calcarea GSE-NOS-MK-12-04C]|uniref:Uncharacterized protein n=1 Tax=Cyanomargarita calcarea GSE-NOS-MK-12-04C TaxID=2839659 RepID=A0A951QQG5_9CYAN|nr:hypothetical protein [Cyanomargarita calcarea GSE-NOS-MK-12-04C]
MILLFTALLATLHPFNLAKSATLEIAIQQQQMPKKMSKSYLLADNLKLIVEETIGNEAGLFNKRRRRRASRNSDRPSVNNY